MCYPNPVMVDRYKLEPLTEISIVCQINMKKKKKKKMESKQNISISTKYRNWNDAQFKWMKSANYSNIKLMNRMKFLMSSSWLKTAHFVYLRKITEWSIFSLFFWVIYTVSIFYDMDIWILC